MRLKDKKKFYKRFLIIVLLLIGVGYAYFHTDLKINGDALFKRSTWNIHWKSIDVKSGSVSGANVTTAATITGTANDIIEYAVTLTNPRDYYEFDAEAENTGTMDGMISSYSLKAYSNNQEITLPDYITHTITYEDGTALAQYQYLEAGETEKFTVRLAYRDDIEVTSLPGSDTSLSFKVQIVYVQADNRAIDVDHPSAFSFANRQVPNAITVGDEVCVGNTECFYVLNSDSSTNGTTTLMAKYNLLVGEQIVNSTVTTIDSNTPGYGLQQQNSPGVYRFASTNYWKGNVSPSGPYIGNTYTSMYEPPTEYYSPFVYVYDSNSLLYPFVESYKTALKNMGAKIIKARIPSYSDIETPGACWIGAVEGMCDNDNFISGDTEYWLGDAAEEENIVNMYHGAVIPENSIFGNDPLRTGIRPVIDIYTKYLS